ncbi:tRNA(fMet)-specific endonuclease VapC [Phycisphaerae bacterium RAS1]|nr:tRNA(fMet)-specific endonuclease VapC [Phycisphaerae bacterium RAS1]
MGVISRLHGQRLYLDSNVLIYAVEGLAEWAEKARLLLAEVDQGRCVAVVSELAIAECLAKPLSEKRRDVVDVYLSLLQTGGGLLVVPVDRQILIDAAAIRAESALKLADAIHAATARAVNCAAFVTNDLRLHSYAGVQTAILADVVQT